MRSCFCSLLFILSFSVFSLYGKEEESDKTSPKEEKTPQEGNFALPTSQQPAGLFAFGGNIIDQGEVQYDLFTDYFKGKQRVLSDVIPGLLFGVTDSFSLFFNFPCTSIVRDRCQRSRGLEDFFVQLEYAFYSKTNKSYADQATILANVTFPTGSAKRTPPTGFGASTVFLGGTYYRTWVDWVVFAGPGAILTTSHRGTKFGNQFFYQCGIGRNIPSPKGRIYAWMFEVDGQYSEKSRIRGSLDRNSGGNVIYATPSLWISSKHFLLQCGVSLPLMQRLFGRQRKFDYALNFNCAWSIYLEKEKKNESAIYYN